MLYNNEQHHTSFDTRESIDAFLPSVCLSRQIDKHTRSEFERRKDLKNN